MLENQIETYLYKTILNANGACIKLVPPPKGVPDRLVILPMGFIAFVELKRPKGGEIARLQHHWANKIEDLGQRHYFINTITGVNNLMSDWREHLEKVI